MVEKQVSGLQEGSAYGPYHLIRILGEGGGGQVWEADDSRNGRRVALKVMTELEVDSPTALERFEREGRLAASITHPSCVLVFGAEEVESRPTISMELMRGGTLRDRLKESPLEYRDAVGHVLDMIAGLEAAQLAGIIHRDVKPSNCFLEEGGGRTKIGDFGVSRTLEVPTDLTATGAFIGTPSYASPEQVRGEALDFRSDVYSVGVTLYELLTGQVPFQGQPVAVVAQILGETPAAPSSINPAVPTGLDRVVLRLMAKDPAKRFPSYAALRKALTPFTPGVLSAGGVGRRVLASAIDATVLSPLSAVSLSYMAGQPGWIQGLASLVVASLGFLYYWLLETRWGASLGKRLLGLTVTSTSGERLGARTVGLRTLLFSGFGAGPLVLAYTLGVITVENLITPDPGLVSFVNGGFGAIGFIALFLTMRPKNGFAGIHDLLSDSRVVSMSRSATVGAPDRPLAASGPVHPAPPILGPYAVESAVWQAPGARLLVARDSTLDRPVWIHHYDDPEAGPALDRLTRSTPGRLGWLQGSRADGDSWDAYAMPSGSSLTEWVRAEGHLSWGESRQILRGVARELSQPDVEAPTALSPGRVWVDGTGEPKLLDFAVDPTDEGGPGDDPTATEPAEFLRRMATYSLEGRDEALPTERSHSPRAPVPGHAHEFLENLFAEDAPSASAVAEQLGDLMTEAPAVTGPRRGMAMLFGAFVPLSFAFIGLAPAALTQAAPAIPLGRVEFFAFFVTTGAAGTGLVAVLLAPLLGGGPVLRALDVQVRTTDGARAGRWRCAARTGLAWSPFLISGVLLYLAGPTSDAELVWMTRSGSPAVLERAEAFDPGAPGYHGWSVSPDGASVALTKRVDTAQHIWIKQLPDGPFERLTSDAEIELYPVWTPDGLYVTYVRDDASSEPGDHFDVWQMRVDGTGLPELLLDDERSLLQSRWSPDGEWLIMRTFALPADGVGLRDIVGFRPGRDSAPMPLVATTEYAEQAAALSPDGRWLAYSSDESGRDEVFVRPFPDVESDKQQISMEGGIAPRWAHNGRELFYVNESRDFVAASIETDTGFRVLGRETLFTISADYLLGANFDFYDVAPDDEQFLMGRRFVLSAGNIFRWLVAILPWVIGLGFTLAKPERGPHDRIAGTYLVPE